MGAARMGLPQIVIDGALFDAEGLGDFQDRQTLLSQDLRPRGRGFGCALLAPGVDAAFFLTTKLK
jgi:hypothetical protein